METYFEQLKNRFSEKIAKEIVNIQDIIEKHRFLHDRITELQAHGYRIFYRFNMSGVGTITETKTEIRIAIRYCKGKYNGSYCVILNK